MISITYINDDDRAFGLAGMTISLAALDAIDRIQEISMDSEGPMVHFSSDYYFCGGPMLSAKATWNNLIRNFHLTTSMAVGNIMARSMVRSGERMPTEVMNTLKDVVIEEGRETCALEDDEIDALFNKALAQNHRLFSNPRMIPAVNRLADLFTQRRSMSGRELEEALSMLHF